MITDLNTTNPLSFIEWKQYYNDNINATELSALYNEYLLEWKDNKLQNNFDKTSYTRDIYTEFLKNVSLESLNNDIATFINNIDTDDIYELELAVHYFVEVIKNQLTNTKKLRDEVQFSVPKNKLKNSKHGITQYIKNYLIRLLSTKEIVKDVEDLNLDKISNNMEIVFNNYIADEFIYDIHNFDKDVILNLKNRVRKETKNVIQTLAVNINGKKLKVQTNSIEQPQSILTINDPFTDYKRLPARYFRGEVKTLENLIFTLEKNLIEKFISSDLYQLIGNSTNADVKQIATAINPTANFNQRTSANKHKTPVNLKSVDIFPHQLSFNNTGTTNFCSKNLTFTINLSAFDNIDYIIPDPYKYEPGLQIIGYVKDAITGEVLRNIKKKQRTPLLFTSKNTDLKNDVTKSAVDIYDNKILRNYGYQSQENSNEYSLHGINKRQDNISFWTDDSTQLEWKNTDTYPITSLNQYPEEERLDDLLINNNTGIKLRSDIYGNEFFYIKPAYPKRYAGTEYITTDSSSSTGTTTAAEYYDGLYFNTVLSAISSSHYKANGELYTTENGEQETTPNVNATGNAAFGLEDGNIGESLHTSPFDEIVIPTQRGGSDVTQLTGASADGFNGQLGALGSGDGTGGCATLKKITNNLGDYDASVQTAIANNLIDGGPFNEHPGKSADLITNYFTDTTIPYFTIDISGIYSSTTTYELSTTNQIATSAAYLFDQDFLSAGEVYVRNVYSQVVEPLSSAFANVFNKHTATTKETILTAGNIIDFDIIESTICIQTSAETLTELYKFEEGIFKNAAGSKSLVT